MYLPAQATQDSASNKYQASFKFAIEMLCMYCKDSKSAETDI